MVDFTDCIRKNKTYSGANGSKISVMYNDERYMIKFPSLPSKNKNISYTNSCILEYIGSKIYSIIGVDVQEVLLGTFTINKNTKIVVACKDFTTLGIVLQDFVSLKNQIVDTVRNGYGTELSDIIVTFQSQSMIDYKQLTERFWDMFIVDTLIGDFYTMNLVTK